jgi:hypothetical protein
LMRCADKQLVQRGLRPFGCSMTFVYGGWAGQLSPCLLTLRGAVHGLAAVTAGRSSCSCQWVQPNVQSFCSW